MCRYSTHLQKRSLRAHRARRGPTGGSQSGKLSCFFCRVMNMLNKTTCMLALLLLSPVLILRGAPDTNIKPSIPFTIHTHGVALTEEDIKTILDEAQDILTNNDVTISFDISDSFDSHRKVIDHGKINGCDAIWA